MKVSGIFKTLIVVVACVMLGALILNVLLPNVTASIINAVEDMIYQATAISFDFNGDGTGGQNSGNTYEGDGDMESLENGGDGVGVEGFN